MIKEIIKFVADNKRYFVSGICAFLGAAAGYVLSDENASEVVGKVFDDVHITIGKPASTTSKSIPKLESGEVDYSKLNYYGREALKDKQEHEIAVLKLKQEHEEKMARIKAEKED